VIKLASWTTDYAEKIGKKVKRGVALLTDKRDKCNCHRECTIDPHYCQVPCVWPNCLTKEEYDELIQGI
jgi:hypothetical protein